MRIEENDLTLTILTDEDIPGLVDLALNGIHEPDAMPFSTPWTAVEPERLPANSDSLLLGVRAQFTPEKFDLLFAVQIEHELAGIQALHATDFGVTRTAETGSWLGQSYRAAESAPGCDARSAPSRSIISARWNHLRAFLDNRLARCESRKSATDPMVGSG